MIKQEQTGSQRRFRSAEFCIYYVVSFQRCLTQHARKATALNWLAMTGYSSSCMEVRVARQATFLTSQRSCRAGPPLAVSSAAWHVWLDTGIFAQSHLLLKESKHDS